MLTKKELIRKIETLRDEKFNDWMYINACNDILAIIKNDSFENLEAE